MSTDTGRPLLVTLRALKLGDFLTAVPALRALARAFPDHEKVLAAPAWLEPLARMSGAVDRVHPAPVLTRLGLGTGQPDVAVNLHGRGPRSHRVVLATHPRRLVAFANPDIGASAGLPQWRDDEHEMARWCRLLDECGIPANRADFALPKPPGDGPCAGATVIHPGAASVARRWPPSRWAEVAHAEQAAGRRVVITGSADEVGVAQAVAHLAGLAQDDVMAGRTDVVQLAALIACAGRVLCGDTGVAHLATAFGTPSVVLFGPMAPSEWGPPPGRRQHIALWAGRRGDTHGEQVDPGLLQIHPGDVIDAISRLDGVGIPA